MMEDLTGKQFGPYQIVAPLGEGGMAAVYKAYQPAMERYVALKVLPRHFASDPHFAARFQREAKLLAQLQHPHILPVFDYGQVEGYSYIVMPFIQTGTLTDSLRGEPLPLPRIRRVISQVGEALNYAHRRGLVHRDVKPSNVLIDESGNCLLTDFGLARMVEGSVGLTTTGAVLGTPAYMSPEQGSGHKIDARSDIYSLGVILYELATGRVPYKAETPIAVVFKHISGPLPPPRSLKPDLPEPVERVILKALARNPGERYQTARDLVEALELAVAEAPTMAKGPEPVLESTTIEPAIVPTLAPDIAASAEAAVVPRTPKKRMPGWALGLIAVIVVLMAGGGILLVNSAKGPSVPAIAQAQPSSVASPEPFTSATLPTTARAPSSPTPRPAPTMTAPPRYRARIWITTTSDWTTLRLVDGAKWSPTVAWASAEASHAAYDDDGLLRLMMPIGEAGGSQSVRMMVNADFLDLKTGGTVLFEIERGSLGSTQVEVMNQVGESPVSVGVYEWSEVRPEPPNTYTFEVDAARVMTLQEVSIDLGVMNVPSGLRLVGDPDEGDGRTAPANIGGKDARVTVANGAEARFIYFDVDDAFLEASETHVSISVEYFDQAAGADAWFDISYDSPGAGLASYYKATPPILLTNSGQWKTATLDLPDAYFGGRQNYEADFRIGAPDRDMYFNAVTVTKK